MYAIAVLVMPTRGPTECAVGYQYSILLSSANRNVLYHPHGPILWYYLHTAVVLANGQIKRRDISGSIHAVGRALLGQAPRNGWEHWYCQDPATGLLDPIDRLRESVRATMAP